MNFTGDTAGDAADELLGGYSFTHQLSPEAWSHNRERMTKLMKFGSHPIGGSERVRASLAGNECHRTCFAQAIPFPFVIFLSFFQVLTSAYL